MAAWLLTWNPEKWEWDNYDEECEEASKAQPLEFTWSCVSKKAQAGTEGTFESEHWDDNRAGHNINYVAGECDTLLNYKTQEILDVSVLDEKCPQQYWHPQSLGIRIKDEVLAALKELWIKITEDYDYPENPEESVYYDDGTAGIVEGAKKLVYTTIYERDPKVRREFLKGRHLKCEVCGFDFEEVYGKLGAGYIEVHHKKPVSEGKHITDLNTDLVMLCSNCHRMIHRGKDHMITVEELKSIIDSAHKKHIMKEE